MTNGFYAEAGQSQRIGTGRLHGRVYGLIPVSGGRQWAPVTVVFGLPVHTARFSPEHFAAHGGAALPLTRAVFLYPVLVKTAYGNLWGYIDDRGRMAVPPQYEYALDFQDNGLAIVQRRGKQGVIDRAGRYVVPPIYNSISGFSEGLASVIDDQGFKVIDDLGHILTPKAYDYIGTYRSGRAVFSSIDADGRSRYGYLDFRGKEAVPARYEEAGEFTDGKAVVKVKDREYALIDTNGEPLATYPYSFVGSPGDGLLAFQQEASGKYGYIDEAGKVVIAPRFTGALPFEGGRAVVNMAEDFGNRYGLIDKKGAFLIKPEYNDVNPLGEDRFAVGKATDPAQPFIGSVYALADSDGRYLTDFKFAGISEYARGYASVSDNGTTCWIDRSGRPVASLPRLEGSGTMTFVGNLISANVDQRQFYYDLSGKAVWKPNTTIPLKPPYRIRELKYKPNKDYLVYYPQVEGMLDPEAERNVNRKLKQKSAVNPVPPHTQLDASYTGDFAVAFYRDHLLVLELDGYNYPFGAAHGMPSREYVHINLVIGETYALKDLFKPGSPYVRRISDIIRKQIATDPQYSYVFPDSFKEVSPTQLFYVTEDALHIVFPPYEIGPYAVGFPTFAIPYSELAGIIDTDGRFWKSFH